MKIIFVGGGTLGHIYPFLPIVKRLKDKYELYFIGTKNGLEKNLMDKVEGFIKCYYLEMQGLRRSVSLYNFKTIKLYLKCKNETRKLLKELKPDLVIGMGGYISGVVIKETIKQKIKTIIHEQNAVMGFANRLVEKKVNKVILSFPVENKLKNKHVLTIGNPRLQEIYDNHKVFVEDKKLVLIVGGSRGSDVMNEVALKSKDKLIYYGYKIVLITGNKYYEKNQNRLKALSNENFEIISFTVKLIDLIKKAYIVVSRSGATTLVELMALGKICLLIPSPNVTSNHQEKNADILVKNNGALKLLEKDLNANTLIKQIRILDNLDLRIKFKNSVRKLANLKAADDFTFEVEKLLSEK